MTDVPVEAVDWIELLGRLHPTLVHLPIGLVFAVGLIELFGFGEVPRRFVVLRRAALVVAALCAALTSTSGWFLASGGGYDVDVLTWHRWLSVAFAAALGLAAVADLSSSAFARRLAVMLALALVVLTGHQGGTLTHGATYLTRGAPPWMRRAIEAISPATYRSPSADPAPGAPDVDATPGAVGGTQAEPSAQGARDARLVHELLAARCVRCHGPDKHKAGLRLDQRDGLLSVISPGAAPDSELYRRVTLPQGHGDEMPPEGQPLEEGELASLRRWINAGAPAPADESREAAAPGDPGNADD